MVQKHDATRLHYDFRLELDGVLKSWAVTAGRASTPPTSASRSAPRTIRSSYATFEGTIPKGEYGGGTVMLWDRGTLDPASRARTRARRSRRAISISPSKASG